MTGTILFVLFAAIVIAEENTDQDIFKYPEDLQTEPLCGQVDTFCDATLLCCQGLGCEKQRCLRGIHVRCSHEGDNCIAKKLGCCLPNNTCKNDKCVANPKSLSGKVISSWALICWSLLSALWLSGALTFSALMSVLAE